MRWSRLPVVLVLGSTSALLMGACKTGDSGGTVTLTDGNAAAAKAADRTAAPGSVRFALRYEASQSTEIKLTGGGAFDFDGGKGSMKVTVDDQSTELIVTKDTIYGKLPGLLAGGSKPWIAFTVGENTGVLGGLDQLVRLADPRDALARLPLASDMKRVAAEKVRGVDTVHFRGKVDLSDDALDKLPAKIKGEVRDVREQFELTSYPLDLWLDQEGRVRRIESDLTGTENGQPISVKTSLELFDFGEPVSVVVPPPSQVQDASSFTNPNGEPQEDGTPVTDE